MFYQIEWIYAEAKEWGTIPTRYESFEVAVESAKALADMAPKAGVRVVKVDPEIVWHA